MPILTIDGMQLKEMFLSGAALVEMNRQNIDALNVFPVPDGDTGTNMSQTIGAAMKELNGRTFIAAGEVASAVSRGALKGARGNSGVILSQILRGLSRTFEGHEEIDAALFVKGLRCGADTAYKAIMKPKEGTILTVARVVAEEAERALPTTTDMLEMLDVVLRSGDAILKKTPDMLPVLKQAGVVDSGGKGLMVFWTGFRAALAGEPIDSVSVAGDMNAPLPGEFVDEHSEWDRIEDITFAYCTEFIVSHPRPDMKDSEVARLRKRLERIGDCVVVIGDLEVVKVHVHTNEPGKAIQMALELGELDSIKVDNMLEEFRERQAMRAAQKAVEKKDYGIVSVVLGDGLVAIFNDLGVDAVVDGGQTMNPSIEDLVKAIDSIGAKNVFVLPNNTNIILAAQQAAELTEANVHVIPTKSIPMGISAAVAFQPDKSPDENAALMMEAADLVHTASVTYAVRDTNFDGREIHEGDIMGLIDNRISCLGDDVSRVVMDLLETMVTDDAEMITVFYGSDVTEEQANALLAEIEEKYDMCDVMLHMGGQPLYFYIVAVE